MGLTNDENKNIPVILVFTKISLTRQDVRDRYEMISQPHTIESQLSDFPITKKIFELMIKFDLTYMTTRDDDYEYIYQRRLAKVGEIHEDCLGNLSFA